MTRRRWGQKRFAVAFAALALVTAACGGSKGSGASASNGTNGGAGGTATSVVIGPDGSSSIVQLPNNNGGGDAASPNNGDGGGGGGGAAALDASGAPGSFAAALLSPAQTNALVVEVRAQSGTGPQSAAMNHLTAVLADVSGKPVSVAQGAGVDGGARAWSADELRGLGAGGTEQRASAGVIHLLYVHGSFGGDGSVLGVAVRGDTAAIFVDQIESASTPLVGSSGIETAVTTHEVGHLLGLVDLFLHTGRQDPDHPGHSRNQSSVMYWAVESNLVADLLTGGPPKDFDSADLADLATIRNGG